MKTKINKYNIIFAVIFTAFASGIFMACSREDHDITQEQEEPNYTYLDFTSEKKNMTQEEYNLLISEAGTRMGKYVQFENNQFVISSSCTADKVGVSPKLFDYMKGLMHDQNNYVKTLNGNYCITNQNTLIHTVTGSPIRLKTRSEQGSGSDNYSVTTGPWGNDLHIHISHATLKNVAYVGAAAAIIVGAKFSNIIKATCGLSSLSVNHYVDKYPNGIKITIPHIPYNIPSSGGCLPYSISHP